MDINFSNQEITFIYGHFCKEMQKLEELKSFPNCPISKKDLNQDIKLFNSIVDKLREAYPELSKLDNYNF